MANLRLQWSRLPGITRRRPRLMMSWCAAILLIAVLRLFVVRMSADPSLFEYRALPADAPKLPTAERSPIQQATAKKNGTSQTVSLTLGVRCARRPDHVIPPVHDKWYAYYNPPTHREVYVYSAFMDDRHQNKVPEVRLLAVSSSIKNATYCQFWYDDEDEPVTAKLVIRNNGRGHKIADAHYEQYYFNCRVPKPHPVLVSVTSRPCETPQSLIPITYPSRGMEHEFAVCVPVTFGKVDPYQLIEWVEAHQILGVTEINVYYVHMSKEALAPFRYYESLGIMKLYNIPTVPKWENTYNGNKLSSMVSLNDCMYRNMYRVKWIIDIDYDEIIIPNSFGVSSYTSLLKTIDKALNMKKSRAVNSYTFSNAYYWIGCAPPQFDKPEHSVMMRHVRREPVSHGSLAPKTILSPLTCISLFNHYCYHPFKIKGQARTINVNSTIATSHHYRKLRNKKLNCERLRTNGTDDLSVHKLKPQLEERYQAVIKDMKL